MTFDILMESQQISMFVSFQNITQNMYASIYRWE